MNQRGWPTEWAVRQLEEILIDHRNGTWGPPVTEGPGYPILRSTNMRGGRLSFTDVAVRVVDKSTALRCKLENGDILVNKSSGSPELVGRPVLFRHPGDDKQYLFSNFILRMRPDTKVVVPEFLQFYLSSPIAKGVLEHIHRTTSGLRNLKTKPYLSQDVPIPSLAEQRRIVARIEELMRRINQAKSLRQKAAGEANDLMSAALYQVFSAAEADSWEKRPIGALLEDIRTGTTPPSKEKKYYGGEIQWFTPGDLGEHKYLVRSNRAITPVAIKEGKARIFKTGTILFVGIGATLGKVGIAGDNVSSNQQITGMLFKNRIIPDFAYYWFRYKYSYIRALSPAATLPIINQEGLQSLLMEFPSVDGQRRIVAYLDRLQAQVSELQCLQSEIAEDLNSVTASVLSKAFRGEL